MPRKRLPTTHDRIKPLLLREALTERERAYWLAKEPWNFMTFDDGDEVRKETGDEPGKGE